MRDSWLKLVSSVLRPARPRLEACLRERERHLEARRLVAERREAALADCRARIEAARAEVFAADDGVVGSRMTDLEREWRRLSRSDPDDGLMDLWARIAPSSWIDRKLWRGSPRALRLDAAVALASDVEGVEAAEAAAAHLRATLEPRGVRVGARVRWRAFAGDLEHTAELLAAPLGVARAVLSRREWAAVALERAARLAQEVHDAALARLPERAALARALARAAYLDDVWRAAALPADANPATPLHELWRAGYTPSAIDDAGVTIEIPPL